MECFFKRPLDSMVDVVYGFGTLFNDQQTDLQVLSIPFWTQTKRRHISSEGT